MRRPGTVPGVGWASLFHGTADVYELLGQDADPRAGPRLWQENIIPR